MTRGYEQPKTLGPDTVVEGSNDPAERAPVPHDEELEPLSPSQETEISDDFLGRVIAGKYRLMKRVGRGGMGSVYEAVHLQTERRTALKILNRELSRDLKVVARFRREAMAASRLNHENCVAVYDFGEDDDGTFFISMEFVDGSGLGTELRRVGHAFEADRVIRIGTQILAALDAAHAAGIIHRDLKPQNVMVTELAGRTDFVKVVDFGIAKFVDHGSEPGGLALTMPGTIFGTPEYMSPEQARGEELDGRSDVYSAAVVLWHMLLGRSPFRGQNVRETLMNVFQMSPPRPSEERPEDNIPRGLEDVLLRALHKDATTRIQSPAALLSELAAFAKETSVPGRPSPRLPTPGIVDGSSPPETLPADYLADGTRRPTSLAHGGMGVVENPAPKAKKKKGPIGPPLPDASPNAAAAPLPPAPATAPPVVVAPPAAPAAAPPPATPHVGPAPKGPPPPDAPAPLTEASPDGASVGKVTVKVQEPSPVAEDTFVTTRARKKQKKASAVPLVASIVLALFAAMIVGGLGVLIISRVFFPDQTSVAKGEPEGEPVGKSPEAAPDDVEDLTKPAKPGAKVDRRARDAAISRAEAALAREKLPAAKLGYQDAIRADRQSAKAHKGLAMVSYRMGDLDTAKAHLERIMELDSKAARQIFGFHAIVKKKIRDRDRAAK